MMKVHPSPTKRNIGLQYDIVSTMPGVRKNLRRLPHIFDKVLELPFHADADVTVEETDGFFSFTLADTDVGPDVVADTVDINPGVTKVIVRSNSIPNVSIMELELDLWRFRLPQSTRPHLASASYHAGNLVLVVPKTRFFVEAKMSEEKEQRGAHKDCEVAIKFGDVFEMSGHMAEQAISPRDAAAMESAENRAFGKTIKGGPASIMLDAAAKNLQSGLVHPHHTDSSLTQDAKFLVEGDPWEESQLSHDELESIISVQGTEDEGASGITIGEALEAAARAIGDKPVDRADAAAIQAAEMIATGTNAALGSGLGAEAQAAAALNARTIYDEDKTKLSEIIEGATNMLTDDKPVTEEDAERVKAAELKGDPEGVVGPDVLRHRTVKLSTTPGGVAEAVIAAARINKSDI